ncbi:hypothetical protein N7492_001037 [Penicillium capsulatum]|uniref:Calponin-homology (CH) domain-containing protein n=1 Tax=Penicillium capsulatum TaxID=69766 RepID=A0A9W9IWZ0_9EURO|nr:hypothetical protein N7492_001037 [Penicillium capsulatum]KAJ6129903.1 hypothetical protein N7512_002683 [Penicillium capsulatum]
MSALFNEAITPCPSRSRSSGPRSLRGSDEFESILNEDSVLEPTGQVEFTTEIRQSTLTGARPRRSNCTGSGFQIHEDIAEKPSIPAEKKQRPNKAINTPTCKSSLLAQPAQRFRPNANAVPGPPRAVKQKTETRFKPRDLETKGREGNKYASHPKNSSPSFNHQKAELKSHVRRNTVYIPPDDSTVASVFMGLFSPLKKPTQGSLPTIAEDGKINTLEDRIAQRQARKSLAVSARKAPLQPSVNIAQQAAFRVDVAGKNGGKENIPPGFIVDEEKKTTKVASPSKSSRVSIMPDPKPLPPRTRNPKPKLASMEAVDGPPKWQASARSLGGKQKNANLSAPCSTGNRSGLGSQQPKMSASLNARASALSDQLGRSTSRTSKIGTESSMFDLNHKYPSMSDDISKPALYEDNWLSHQETVITQLVNALFECANGDSEKSYDSNGLRLELLGLYQTDEFARLYKRLQSSLSFGNLSTSKDLQERSTRIRQDVGLKRKFLDLWLQSYDPRALVAAVEIVVGRRMSNDIHGPEELHSKSRKLELRKLESFMEAFLLRNDDLQHFPSKTRSTSEVQVKGYQRTVLRSILLVVLLDKGRQCPGISIPRRLFLATSTFKSSAKVLQTLARLLLLSCGDITRQLSHLGCHLSFKQHELLEYNYQIDNIAVDLRDGVRLTKLVEILFFHSDRPQSDSGTAEVALNTGQALSLGDEKDLPLSKHLKYPCISRAAKIFNVQVALSALGSVMAPTVRLDDIRAENIVDGYCEKTIALLWALVSKCGLTSLVDWDDVRKEITRLRRKALSQFGFESVQTKAWLTGKAFDHTNEHTFVLQEWVAILAALKGLEVSNMTTSFSDGKIYQSIIDEYEPYIVGGSHRESATSTRSSSMSLEMRLRLLGCSSQFAHLVCPSSASSHLLDRDFTVGALAFLCSRLLSASKRARAATTLQRVWRTRLAERDEYRRVIAKNLAVHCAAVVQNRNEILWAQEVIARWWGTIKARRQHQTTTQSHSMSKHCREPRKAGRRL